MLFDEKMIPRHAKQGGRMLLYCEASGPLVTERKVFLRKIRLSLFNSNQLRLIFLKLYAFLGDGQP